MVREGLSEEVALELKPALMRRKNIPGGGTASEKALESKKS